MGSIQLTVTAVELWNKIQKQLKTTLLKDLSPNKIKTVVIIFILNHINNHVNHINQIIIILVISKI